MFGALKGIGEAIKKVDGNQIGQLLDQAKPQLEQLIAPNAKTVQVDTPVVIDNTVYTRGKTRALLIGINYFGQKGELRGCLNDVKNMKEYLESLQVFTDFKVLTDAPENPEKPTRNNIVQAMQWLVKDAAPGDCFFLHYSGHGAYVDDTTGDEADGKDETICPVDYAQAGMLIDDEMHKLLVEPLPKGAKMTVVFDCCHSGSGIDLPFTYSIDGKNEILFRDNRLVALESGMNAVKHLANKNVEAAMREAFSALSILKEKQPQPVQGPIKTSDADIVFFSGCKDTQTSADAHIEGAHTGAMSWALLKVLRENPALNLTELLKKLRETLQGKYQQIPQLSTGHMVDVVTKKFTVAY